MSFSRQMQSLVNKYKERPEMVVRGVGIKLFRAVIMDSPVDTGRLRANWRASVNAPDKSVDDPSIYTKKKAASMQGAMDLLVTTAEKVSADSHFYLSNSLPYVRRIEYEGWSHTKAPLGMVHRNVMRFSNLVRVEVTTGRRQ